MADDFNIALRFALIIFAIWLWVLTVRHSGDVKAKWAGICMFAAVVYFYSPEHLFRLTGQHFPAWVSSLMLNCANSLMLTSILLSIGVIVERYREGITALRILFVGWGTVGLLYLAVSIP